MDSQIRITPMDAPSLLYEVGRQVQAVALAMRKHRIVAAQQLCECGRLPIGALPVFGPRCDVAYDQWVLAQSAMRCIVEQTTTDPPKPIGRVKVGYPGRRS